MSLFDGDVRVKAVEETPSETFCLTCSGSSDFELGLKPELVLILEASFTK